MIVVEYACLDGSPFPVTFADTADVTLRWIVDREHAPTAMTPLAEAVREAGRPGAERAYAESAVPMPSTLARPGPAANGYDYFVDEWLPAAEREAFEQALAQLASEHGGTAGVWSAHTLPRVQEACAWLEATPPDTPFRALAERRAYAWSHTGVAGVVSRRDLNAMAAVCEPVVGEGAELVAHALAQGSRHETLAADEALAKIAAGAGDLDGFLATYGQRSTGWTIDEPTALERPELVDAQLRLLRRHRTRDIGEVRSEAGDRRRRLADDIRARLAGDDERARFDRRLARLESFVPVREARARWQLVASGYMRAAVRRRGQVLVDRGAIDEADDVFFLTPDEYDDPPAAARDALAKRRADHEHWSAVTPPTVIGDVAASAVRQAADGMLRGAPGAPGTATGTARVICDLADAERLGPGDVLVTTMTAPPWTPLFAVAGAVVTDSGDAVSHVAIAARDYGIPCVVGTHHATVLVPDGAAVTVDGDRGTVTVDGRD